MPRPKSILQPVEVDEALKAHNCQHNQNHRIERGAKRLKVRGDRAAENYCVACALAIILRDSAKLEELRRQLGPMPEP